MPYLYKVLDKSGLPLGLTVIIITIIFLSLKSLRQNHTMIIIFEKKIEIMFLGGLYIYNRSFKNYIYFRHNVFMYLST